MEPICISTNDPYGANLEAARATASLTWTPPPGNGMGANPFSGPTGGITGPDVPSQGRETPAGPDPATGMEEETETGMCPEERHGLRTRRQAIKAGALPVRAKMLAIPTLPRYQDALSIIRSDAGQTDRAHLQMLQEALARQIVYKDGKLYLNGQNVDDDYLSGHHDNRPGASADVDLPLLYYIYSLIYHSLQSIADTEDGRNAAITDYGFRKYSLRYYIPTMFRDMGLDARCNARNVEAFVSKLGSYHTVWGIIPTKRGPSHYPALMVFGHDAEDNSIEITSPYFNQIIMRSRRESVKRDSLGNPVLKRNGTPVILPSHTHLINSGIKKERNTRAVEIVRIVTVMIEQTGDQGTPHISAQTIIDRCSNLADDLAKCSSINQQNNLLRRTFTKAWELLETQTVLKETYRNIQLPERTEAEKEKNKVPTPTMTHLDRVFRFPHEGKIGPKDRTQD